MEEEGPGEAERRWENQESFLQKFSVAFLRKFSLENGGDGAWKVSSFEWK